MTAWPAAFRIFFRLTSSFFNISAVITAKPTEDNIITEIDDKISDLATHGGPRHKGCLIVVAAGNYNAPITSPRPNLNTGPPFEITWREILLGGRTTTRGPLIYGLGAHPMVMTVAACTKNHGKAKYSNWGRNISVCAPSKDYDPLDDFMVDTEFGKDDDIITTSNREAVGKTFEGLRKDILQFRGHSKGEKVKQIKYFDNEMETGYTRTFGGTSAAAPIVTGVAALVLSVNPFLTAMQTKLVIEETAIKIVDEGAGYSAQGHSEFFGFGLVNASAAVHKALDLKKALVAAKD